MRKVVLSNGDIAALEALALSESGEAPLEEQLRYASAADVDAIIDRRAALAAQSELLANHFFAEAVLAACRIIRDSQGDPHEIIPEAFRPQMGDAFALCRDILRRAAAYRDSRGSARYGGVIRRARAYIGAHFSESGLTLKDVADHVALSNNHFCTVFSRETGMTFIEYLTEVRIRRAGELLRGTNMRTSEVAYAVGYNDPHYFRYLFKKRTGISPRDCRRGAGVSVEDVKNTYFKKNADKSSV